MKVEIQNLTKTWGSFGLKNINLSIASGEYLVLLGPTGAGKTLLLETIMGFHTLQQGKILFDGQDVTEFTAEKRGVGYVPQNSLLFPHMTVRQNIAFGLKMQGKDKTLQEKTANELLELFGLKNLADRLPTGLSGGERQKVALARVLAIDAGLVLLDEPLASVDSETARQLRGELKMMHKEQGKTVVHVTHSLVEGFGLADKIALMCTGEIVQVGVAQEVLAKPKNEFAAQLLGYENVFRAKLVEKGNDFSVIEVGGVSLKVLGSIDSLKLVAIRPEDISVELSQPQVDEGNVFEGVISDFADLGPFVTVTVRVNEKTDLLFKTFLAKSSFIEKRLENGKTVWLKLNPQAIKTIE